MPAHVSCADFVAPYIIASEIPPGWTQTQGCKSRFCACIGAEIPCAEPLEFHSTSFFPSIDT